MTVDLWIDEETIREVMARYFRLFPTDDPYGEEMKINAVVDDFYEGKK